MQKKTTIYVVTLSTILLLTLFATSLTPTYALDKHSPQVLIVLSQLARFRAVQFGAAVQFPAFNKELDKAECCLISSLVALAAEKLALT